MPSTASVSATFWRLRHGLSHIGGWPAANYDAGEISHGAVFGDDRRAVVRELRDEETDCASLRSLPF